MSENRNRSGRDVILRFFEILNTGDTDGLGEIADEEVVTVHPQTRERISRLEANLTMTRGLQQVAYFPPVMAAPEWRAQWVVPEIGEY